MNDRSLRHEDLLGALRTTSKPSLPNGPMVGGLSGQLMVQWL